MEETIQKFKIGDIVKFIRLSESNNIPDYAAGSQGIPSEKLKHGNTVVNESYFREFAIIEDIHDKYYLVEFTDYGGKRVRLGFLEDKLELVVTKPVKYLLVGGHHEGFETLEEAQARLNLLVLEGARAGAFTIYKIDKAYKLKSEFKYD